MIVNLILMSLMSGVSIVLLQKLMKGQLQLNKNLAGRQNKAFVFIACTVEL